MSVDGSRCQRERTTIDTDGRVCSRVAKVAACPAVGNRHTDTVINTKEGIGLGCATIDGVAVQVERHGSGWFDVVRINTIHIVCQRYRLPCLQCHLQLSPTGFPQRLVCNGSFLRVCQCTAIDVCAVGKSLAVGYFDGAAAKDFVTAGLDEVAAIGATDGDGVIRPDAVARACHGELTAAEGEIISDVEFFEIILTTNSNISACRDRCACLHIVADADSNIICASGRNAERTRAADGERVVAVDAPGRSGVDGHRRALGKDEVGVAQEVERVVKRDVAFHLVPSSGEVGHRRVGQSHS